MTTIVEELPSTELANKSTTRPTSLADNSPKARNRQRSERRKFTAAIRVYGSTEAGKSFYEEAHTIDVSTHGALIEMKIAVCVGQKLMLINESTQRQQICKIVNVRNLDTETLVIAVEFPVPHAEFWQVFASLRKVPPSKKHAEAA